MNTNILKTFRDIVTSNGKVISARLNETYFKNINKLNIWLEWNEATKNLKDNYEKISHRMLASDESLELKMCEHCNSKPKIIIFDEESNKRALSKWCSVKCSAKSIEKVSKFKVTVSTKTKEDKLITKTRKEKTMLDKFGYAYNLQRPDVRKKHKENNGLPQDILDKLKSLLYRYNLKLILNLLSGEKSNLSFPLI